MLDGASNGRYRDLLKWGVPMATLVGTSLYYRFRPQPKGINGIRYTYRVPSENICFFHDSTWYENDKRHSVRQITSELIRMIREAEQFVVMDVFLFCLHHASRAPDLIPTTRQIVDAFASRDRPAWFITDPLNIMYGTAVSPPIQWLEEAGVNICVADLNQLRENNLMYAPLWRLGLRWIPTEAGPWFRNPLESFSQTTPWAILEGIMARANHRKLIIADDGDSHLTMVTSSNFEDASCYFANTGVTIRSTAVARHFLEAEKAVARISGMEIPVQLPLEHSEGDALVTPLMGDQIKEALIELIESATPRDYLFLFTQYLAERDLIAALIRASERGVPGTLVLDQNLVSFGNPKSGFPNQITGPEMARHTHFEIRWANTHSEEFHNCFTLLHKPDRCIMIAGSANYTRRGLSNTVLEANVRIEADCRTQVCLDALEYVHWLIEEPHSLPYSHIETDYYWPKYWVHRFLEATGSGTS